MEYAIYVVIGQLYCGQLPQLLPELCQGHISDTLSESSSSIVLVMNTWNFDTPLLCCSRVCGSR